MNPTFTVNVDLAKRKTSVTGLVAVGEKVDVVISGIDYSSIPEWEIDNDEGFSGPALRFRIVTPDGKDLVRFPLVSGDTWNVDGTSLSAEVDFNTMQLREWLCGFSIGEKTEVGIIVDSVVDAMEYGRGTVKILQWAASPAEDPTILPDWRKTLHELNTAIVQIDSKSQAAVSAAETAVLARDSALTYKNSAETAANNAVSSENAAKGFKNDAESASSSAVAGAMAAQKAQTAAETAKTGAEAARDEAKGYAESAAGTLASAATKDELTAEVERATRAESALDERVSENATAIENLRSTHASDLAQLNAKNTAQDTATATAQTTADAALAKANTIIGSDTGKSARTIAGEEVAKIVGSAPEAYDTLKEIADYIASDKEGAVAMAASIAANTAAIKAEKTRAEGVEALKLDKSAVVPPDASATEGQAADAKAAYDALDAKADKTDLDNYRGIADFTVYGFSKWGIKSVTYGSIDQYHIDGSEEMGWTVYYDPAATPIGTISNDCSTTTVTIKGSMIIGWDYEKDEPIYAYTTVVCSRSRSATEDKLLKKSDVPVEDLITTEDIADYATIGRVLYPFVTPTVSTNRVLLMPRRVNTISFSGESLTVEIDRNYGDDPVEERWKTLGAYDLVLVVTVGDTAPNISWGTSHGADSFTPRTDAATDMEIKANTRKVFWISEYSPGEFVVSGWEVPS